MPFNSRAYIPINDLAYDASFTGGSDYVRYVDVSTGEEKKLLFDDLPGGGGGVSNHGALTGLSDDDHSQYHTDARADTWLGSKDIGALSNVDETGASSGQVLTYNGADWAPAAPAGGNSSPDVLIDGGTFTAPTENLEIDAGAFV